MSKVASQPANNSPRRPPGDRPLSGLMGDPKEAPKHTPQRPQAYAAQQQQRAAMSMPPPQGKPVYNHPMAVNQPRRAYPASTSCSQPGAPQQQLPHLRETSRANMPPPRQPGTTVPHKSETWKNQEGDKLEEQFDHLLDSLQVPETVRLKFSTVSPAIKSSILSSTLTSNPAILSSLGLPLPTLPPQSPKARKKLSTPILRKTKSSGELKGDRNATVNVGGEGFVIVASPRSGEGGVMSPPLQPGNMRGQSIDLGRPSQSPRPSSRLFGHSPSPSLGNKTSAKGLGIAMGEQPEAFIGWLSAYKGTDLRMEVARCKKLRMLLRQESTDWVGAFVEMDGYAALRKLYPRPFPALSALLFSEKKPGDLASRQLIVELWLFLFDLFTPVSQTPNKRPTSIRFDEKVNPSPRDVTAFMRSLLVPDLPDPTKDQHEFVTQAHRPRVFKAWVGELSDICRDYFWVMCHASNTLWALEQVDESLVEKPVAPGGATGGVEFEAMNYVATHFKLLNAFAARQAKEDIDKARQLHYDLMASGMDRILVTFRKASTTYYPFVHLELARYIRLLQEASPSGRLPYLISKMVGPPPEEIAKAQYRSGHEWLPMPTLTSKRS
ncbi:hypothetical protein I305_01239 [Cryptococcus gattii E566]|uniref:Formin GTPase-binding domain-containing protein n=1 Tax=Cryptococcus gattii serotype B (strain WM276 / ATCC MYA-4071) TaxID=367775 RepID=E6QZZ4_CRYGW|nr:Hypothetical Protein CGB_B1240C [Cryptococcus gattii WM276]ADV20198.1 Hypothetical Protein CGB_B1240C [Cryptococcus gattii WM276]KIY36378.1 hypothetical protein I305_01239 [Cryptococcus gattii E566]